MNTERFHVSELLIDAAMNKEFLFTTQEAIKYIMPKLTGPVKRRETVIRKAIDRGIEDDVFMQCGNKYQLAIPQGNFLDDNQEYFSFGINENWILSNLNMESKLNEKQSRRKQKKKKPNFRTDKRISSVHSETKKKIKTSRRRKNEKAKNKKSLKKIKSNEQNNQTPKRTKKNKKGKKPTTPLSDSTLGGDSDFSNSMSLQSLDEKSEEYQPGINNKAMETMHLLTPSAAKLELNLENTTQLNEEDCSSNNTDDV